MGRLSKWNEKRKKATKKVTKAAESAGSRLVDAGGNIGAATINAGMDAAGKALTPDIDFPDAPDAPPVMPIPDEEAQQRQARRRRQRARGSGRGGRGGSILSSDDGPIG